jgi:phosphoglucosamine mutase
MSSKFFGTDGIRAEANVYPMTGEVAMKVGRALTYTLLHHPELWPQLRNRTSKKIKIVVGKDTRRSGYMIENAISSGICSMGGEAILLGPLPTPGVAFIAKNMRADAGVVISASHNPFQDNGIKIFGGEGFKASDAIEEKIEELILQPEIMYAATPKGAGIGRAYRIDEAHGRYVVFLKSTFPQEYDLSGMKIALDCANGAAYKSAPLVFEELGADVATMGISPNGVNINERVGALHPKAISELTYHVGAQIGVALDGDADRVVIVDEKGEVIDGDAVIGLCALELQRQGRLPKNAIVTTQMSNVGLELSLARAGITMHRANVGDRFVVEKMKNEGLAFGGEQSGHIIFLDSSTTGDGTLAALKVIELMKRTGKPLSELKKVIELFPQTLVNVKVKERKPLADLPTYLKAVAAGEKELAGKGRIFVRYSGTEPKLRILVEGENADVNQKIANHIQEAITHDIP